jgi:soluble lytic murein transglycosylase-like protein
VNRAVAAAGAPTATSAMTAVDAKTAPRMRDALGGGKPTGPSREAIAMYVLSAATRYRVPAGLILAIINARSEFHARATDEGGRAGLMLLSEQTAKENGVTDRFDPRQNIEGGARYLRALSDEFQGDTTKVIAAFEAGPKAIRDSGDKLPPDPELQRFVQEVSDYLQSFSAASDRTAP